MIQLMFLSWVVSVNRVNILTDLILLEIIDYDIILGMDWLALYHATVDCYSKVVKFDVSNGLSFVF